MPRCLQNTVFYPTWRYCTVYNIIVTRLHTEFIMLEWILPFMNVQQYNIVTLFFIIDKWILCISVHNKVKKICTVFIIHECILSLKKVLFIITVQFFLLLMNFFLLFMNYFIIHEFFSLFMIFLWFFFIIHEVTRIKSQCYHSCLYCTWSLMKVQSTLILYHA